MNKRIKNKQTIQEYNDLLDETDKAICEQLKEYIESTLSEAKGSIWHSHPVWFILGNPVVGYSKRKEGICLLFWSGQTFNEPDLIVQGKFKAAEARYTSLDQINEEDLLRWLEKSRKIQWDYKNIVRRNGVLERVIGAR